MFDGVAFVVVIRGRSSIGLLVLVLLELVLTEILKVDHVGQIIIIFILIVVIIIIVILVELLTAITIVVLITGGGGFGTLQ